MKPESEKYKKVINILINSKPVFNSAKDIEEKVIGRISKVHQPEYSLSDIIDLLFGWIYIGWVRRTLITISVLLVFVFVYQQGVILKQLNFLSRQIITTGNETLNSPVQQVEKLLVRYKSSGKSFPLQSITISEKQLKELLESVNELKTKYKEIEKLIEEDPELKKLIEKKLIENNRKKINL